jgi:hypothetical protein
MSKPGAVAPPRICHKWGCRPRQTVNLTVGYAVRLWLGDYQLDYRSRPVIELLDRTVAVQWWISPQGDGWNGSLSCSNGGPEPKCDLIDSLGMHANVAEMVILRSGRLAHPAGARAITDSVGMRAADLNGDGYFDVVGISNDCRPDFARGHNYRQTSRATRQTCRRARRGPRQTSGTRRARETARARVLRSPGALVAGFERATTAGRYITHNSEESC